MVQRLQQTHLCPRWLTLLVAISGLLLLTLLAACWRGPRASAPAPSTPPQPIATTKAVTDTLPHLLGVIQMPPKHGLTAQGVIHPNGYAYILNNSGSIVVADGPTLVDLMTWPEESRGRLWGITVDPVNKYLYVIDQIQSVLHMITGTQVVSTINGIGAEPIALAVHPQSGDVYIASAFREPRLPKSGGVSVVRGAAVVAWIPLNAIPYALTINPVDGLVYVGYNTEKENLNSLTVISGTTLLTSTSFAKLDPNGIEQILVNPQTGALYLKQGIGVILYKNGSQLSPMYVGKAGHHINRIAIDPRRNWAYATSWEEPTSQVLVLAEDKLIATIPVGRDPRDVVVDETHDYVYVVNRLTGSMSIIRGTEVITTVGTEGWGPTFITLDEQRGYLYVSNSDSASVAVFGFAEAKH